MIVLRVLRRFFRLLGILAQGLVRGNAAHIRELTSNPPDPQARERVQHWFRQALDCIGVEVSTRGAPVPVCLMVSNHISWLDILVLGSVAPISFLSKDDIAHWPMISRLARAGGTLFIRRGERGAVQRSCEEITRALQGRQGIAVFPEGTTGEGNRVLKFYPVLFSAAIEAHAPVQPVALCYPHPRGVHPRVPYTGNDWLVPSIFRVLGCERIHAVVHFGPALETEGPDRKELSAQAHEFVAETVEREVREAREQG